MNNFFNMNFINILLGIQNNKEIDKYNETKDKISFIASEIKILLIEIIKLKNKIYNFILFYGTDENHNPRNTDNYFILLEQWSKIDIIISSKKQQIKKIQKEFNKMQKQIQKTNKFNMLSENLQKYISFKAEVNQLLKNLKNEIAKIKENNSEISELEDIFNDKNTLIKEEDNSELNELDDIFNNQNDKNTLFEPPRNSNNKILAIEYKYPETSVNKSPIDSLDINISGLNNENNLESNHINISELNNENNLGLNNENNLGSSNINISELNNENNLGLNNENIPELNNENNLGLNNENIPELSNANNIGLNNEETSIPNNLDISNSKIKKAEDSILFKEIENANKLYRNEENKTNKLINDLDSLISKEKYTSNNLGLVEFLNHNISPQVLHYFIKIHDSNALILKEKTKNGKAIIGNSTNSFDYIYTTDYLNILNSQTSYLQDLQKEIEKTLQINLEKIKKVKEIDKLINTYEEMSLDDPEKLKAIKLLKDTIIAKYKNNNLTNIEDIDNIKTELESIIQNKKNSEQKSKKGLSGLQIIIFIILITSVSMVIYLSIFKKKQKNLS